MLDPRRKEDATNDRVRTPRYFETDEGWFFRTREGIAIGPYRTEFDAEISSSLLTARLAQLDDESKSVATIHAFIRDPAYGPANEVLRVKTSDSPNGEVKNNGKLKGSGKRKGNSNGKSAVNREANDAQEVVAATSAGAEESEHVGQVRADLPKPDVKHEPLSQRLRSLLSGSDALR